MSLILLDNYLISKNHILKLKSEIILCCDEYVVVGLGSFLIGISIDSTLYRGYVKNIPLNDCVKVLQNMLHMCVRLVLIAVGICPLLVEFTTTTLSLEH